MHSPMRGPVSLLLLAVLTVPADGQNPPSRRAGFWGGFGFSYVRRRATCTECGPQGGPGAPGGSLRFGYTVSRHLLLGIETDLWSQANYGRRAGAKTIGVTWYPSARRGVFLKAGYGSTWFHRQVGTDDDNRAQFARASGPGGMAGIGWDLQASPTVSFTPSVTVWGGRPGDARWLFGTWDRGVSQVAVAVGMEMTFH